MVPAAPVEAGVRPARASCSSLALIGGYLYARSVFNRIEKIDLGDSLTSAESGTNYLIVGSDSRENVTEEGDAGFNGSEAPGGQRADTMMIVHLEGGKAQMLSVPRDLYLPIAGMDESHKINAAYNADLGGGPQRLVDTITQSLGIPIDRYMEIDFVSFAGLVDALGGVTIPFENPAQDEASGLFVPEAGDVELDGDQALAYVRSRHYTETINGELVEDATGDLGRILRQQTFLSGGLRRAQRVEEPASRCCGWPAAWPRACASTTRCRCSTPCASSGACAASSPSRWRSRRRPTATSRARC